MDLNGSTGSVATRLICRDCGNKHDLDTDQFPCSNCGGILDTEYDLQELSVTKSDWERRSDTIWKYRELLPIQSRENIVSMGEGGTPLVDCPNLGKSLDIGSLRVKDEGQNPTNTFKDRGLSVAVSAANEQGVPTVALPSAGNAGQSASAYAARAGLECNVFLNRQAGDLKKQLVRAHGANLHLSEGKIGEAGSAFTTERAEHGWYTVATFQTPFRHEGKKTMGFEVYEDLGWTTPDHIVYPTGGGVGLVGLWKAYEQLATLGWLDGEPPAIHAAQTEGCAPIVRAIENGDDRHTPWADPETIAKGVEIPDPGASPWILDIVDRSGGTGAAVSDQATIDAALEIASSDGVEMCITAAVALAGAFELERKGVFGDSDEVVVINTGAGCKTADLLGMDSE